MTLSEVMNSIPHEIIEDYVLYTVCRPDYTDDTGNYHILYGENELIIYRGCVTNVIAHGVSPSAKKDIPPLQDFITEGTLEDIFTLMPKLYNPRNIIVTDAHGVPWPLHVIAQPPVIKAWMQRFRGNFLVVQGTIHGKDGIDLFKLQSVL